MALEKLKDWKAEISRISSDVKIRTCQTKFQSLCDMSIFFYILSDKWST